MNPYNDKEDSTFFLNKFYNNKVQSEYNNDEDIFTSDNKDYIINPIITSNLDKIWEIYPNDRKLVKEKKLKKNSLDNFENKKLSKNCNNIKQNIKIKKKSGRKRQRTDEDVFKEHNKFTDDNMRRKCKHLVLKNIMDFINEKIRIIYDDKRGNGLFKKELQTINQSQKSDATINFNKNFLKKTIGEIFSDNISSRYTNYPIDYNKILIQKLLNEKDENKKVYFQKLFNLTFIECLMHFRGEKYISELDGLKCFCDIKNEIMEKYDDGVDYITQLEYYIKNYEKIIDKKKGRRKTKKQEDNNK